MVRVSVNDLIKVYGGDVKAVDNVSFTVDDGEFLTLVGPSGSGKSTILRIIAGLVDVTEGQLYFGEKNVTDIPPQERDVAMVFQNYALYPNMNVRENMEFGLKMQGMSKPVRDSAVEEAAEMLQIRGLLDRGIQQLSGGQQQRVALGRSLVRDPDVFLLDEPLANLDAKLRVEMRATLVELQRQLGATTIYVTHNQIEAMTMSDRVAVLNYGEIQQLDEPQELYRNPANKFVAEFIGTPSMNFLDCRVRKSNGTTVLETDISDFTLNNEGDIGKQLNTILTDDMDTIFGIRPQNISIGNEPDEGDLETEMEVTVVETGGDEFIIHLEKYENRIRAVIDEGYDISRGDRVKVSFEPKYIHLFDSENEDAIF